MSEQAKRLVRWAVPILTGLALVANTGCRQSGPSERPPGDPKGGGLDQPVGIDVVQPGTPPIKVQAGHVTIDTGRTLDPTASDPEVWHLTCETPATVKWFLGEGACAIALEPTDGVDPNSCADPPAAPVPMLGSATPKAVRQLLPQGSTCPPDDGLTITYANGGITFHIRFTRPISEDATTFLGIRRVSNGAEITQAQPVAGTTGTGPIEHTVQTGPMTLTPADYRVQVTLAQAVSGQPAGEHELGETENYLLKVTSSSAQLVREGESGFSYALQPIGQQRTDSTASD